MLQAIVEITDNMARISALIVADLTDRQYQFAQKIAERMRDYAPVATGWLRDNIYADLENGDAVVRSDADYSWWVNYGTSTTAAQPFVEPAIEDVMSDAGGQAEIWTAQRGKY